MKRTAVSPPTTSEPQTKARVPSLDLRPTGRLPHAVTAGQVTAR